MIYHSVPNPANNFMLIQNEALSENYVKKDGIYFSALTGLTMSDFIERKKNTCKIRHNQPCERCSGIIKMACAVEQRGIVGVRELYKMTTHSQYKSDKAVRKVMQLNSPTCT